MKKWFPYLAICCLCWSCENDLKKVQEMNSKESGVEVAKDIETYYYNTEGRLRARLTAPLLHRYMIRNPYVEITDGLQVYFYNDSLQVESVLTARKGYYNEGKREMWVKDSVVVVNRDGMRLDCEDLHWNPETQRFYTHNPANVTTPTNMFKGENGLIANQDFSWYQFYNTSGVLVDSTLSPE